MHVRKDCQSQKFVFLNPIAWTGDQIETGVSLWLKVTDGFFWALNALPAKRVLARFEDGTTVQQSDGVASSREWDWSFGFPQRRRHYMHKYYTSADFLRAFQLLIFSTVVVVAARIGGDALRISKFVRIPTSQWDRLGRQSGMRLRKCCGIIK